MHLDKIFTCIHRHQRTLLTNDLLKIQLQFRPKLSSKNSFTAFGQGKWTVSGTFSLNGWRPRNAGKWVLESVAEEIGSSHKSDKVSKQQGRSSRSFGKKVWQEFWQKGKRPDFD